MARHGGETAKSDMGDFFFLSRTLGSLVLEEGIVQERVSLSTLFLLHEGGRQKTRPIRSAAKSAEKARRFTRAPGCI